MDKILNRLAQYITVLKTALDSTNQANERPLLLMHLAASAEMFAVLNQSNDLSAIKPLVKLEVQSHGRSFISGHFGEEIDSKWSSFINETGLV